MSTLFTNRLTGSTELLGILPQRASVSANFQLTAVTKGVDVRVH